MGGQAVPVLDVRRTKTDATFRAAIAEAGRILGWRVHRFDSGPVDLMLARGGRLVFAAARANPAARLELGQRAWLDELRRVSENSDSGGAVTVYRWGPADWDEIADTLR